MKLNAFTKAMPNAWLPKKLLRVTKLTTLLLIVTLVQVSAKGYSRKINLNEKNINVTVKVANAATGDASKVYFKDLPSIFKIAQNDMVLSKKESSLLYKLKDKIKTELVRFKVTGKVTDETGQPLPGVTVMAKGTTIGVQTNAAGEYTLNVPEGSILIFSFVGYETRTLPANGTVINVSLHASAQKLGEVVVTGALGIKVQERQLGYATATIDNQLLTQGKATNAATALEGKVSGLQINTTDNGVNPGTRIVLRGNRSITGNNEALLVVDGVPLEDDSYINTINPEDIQDVNILKGAVAASIYGSKASNGVIVITTKKGIKGKTSVTISNTTQIQSVSYMPSLQTEFGGYGGEGGVYTNPDGTVNAVPFENQNYGPPFNGKVIPLAYSPIYGPNGVTIIGWDTLHTTYSNKPNNRRDFFNNALSNQFNVSVDAGGENSTLHVGFQDAEVNGVTPNDLYVRDNLRIGGTQTMGKFSLEYNVSYDQSRSSTYGASYDGTSSLSTGYSLYYQLLSIGPDIPLSLFKNPNSQYGNVNSYYNLYATNPYWTVDNSRDNSVNYIWLASMNLSYKITPWLTLSDRMGLTEKTSTYKDTRPQVQFAPYAIAGLPLNEGGEAVGLQYVYAGESDETYYEQHLNNDIILAFNKKFGKFSINALAGANFGQNYERYIYLGSNELQFPGDYNVSNGLGIPSYGEDNYTQREAGIYEKATVGYNNYLFLDLTNRDEWNSVLSLAHDHYEYPGGDLSFVFTDAFSALKDKNILSYGKVHTAITQVANINLAGNPFGAYLLQNPFYTASGFPYGSLGGFTLSSTNNNQNIQPELTTEYEVGGEFGFLNNRIKLNVTAYHSNSKNQSLTSNVSGATGFTQQIVNAGLVTNDGQEIDLNVTALKTKSWTWDVGINYSHYKNDVVSLAPGQSQLSLGNSVYAVVGKPYPIIEATDFLRDPAGQVIVDKTTGMPNTNPNLVMYGTTNPTHIIGITSSLQYKAWNFSFVIDYRGGNQIFNTQGNVEGFTGVSSQSAENGRQRFIFPNSVVNTGTTANPVYTPNKSVAVDNGGDTDNDGFWLTNLYNNVNSPFVDDGSFIKLREAKLSYTLPTAFLAKKVPFIKRGSVSLIGRNLLMFLPKSNTFTDPEFSDAGSGNAIGSTSVNETPPTRFYGANLTVTF